MELILSEELQQGLHAAAQALGTTPEAVTTQILTKHIAEWQMRRQLDSNRADKIEAHIEWMKRDNPNYETTDPYAIDWQTIKAEGRRY